MTKKKSKKLSEKPKVEVPSVLRRGINLEEISEEDEEKENYDSWSSRKGAKVTKTRKKSVGSLRLKRSNPVRQILETFPKNVEKEESPYQSRRLLIRQVMNLEVQKGPKDWDEASVASESDSWAAAEEKFSQIYEPIPFSVRMSELRKMTREEILARVKSDRIRVEFGKLSRSDILRKIESMKRESGGEADYSVMSRNSVTSRNSDRQENIYQSVSVMSSGSRFSKARLSSPIYENAAKVKRSSSFAGKVEKLKPDKSETTKMHQSVLYETEAVVHAEATDFSSSDEIREPPYISRSEILRRATINEKPSKANVPPKADIVKLPKISPVKKDQKVTIKDEPVYISRSALIGKISSRTVNDESDVNESDWGSVASRSSGSKTDCDTCSECSCSSCGSDNTLTNAPSHHKARGSYDLPSVRSTPEPVPLAEVKLRKLEFEKQKLLRIQSTQDSKVWSKEDEDKIYEPVPASIFRTEMEIKELRRQLGNSEKLINAITRIDTPKRRKLIKQLRAKLLESLEAKGDPLLMETKQEELRDLLKKALDSGTDTISNVSLGLIYVPMEDNTEVVDVSVQSLKKEDILGSDTFGSLDSLIFEPKPVRKEDIEKVQNVISNQFEYLNNHTSTGSGSEKYHSLETAKSNELDKDDSDSESVTSFNSVIYQGEKMLKEAELAQDLAKNNDKSVPGDQRNALVGTSTVLSSDADPSDQRTETTLSAPTASTNLDDPNIFRRHRTEDKHRKSGVYESAGEATYESVPSESSDNGIETKNAGTGTDCRDSDTSWDFERCKSASDGDSNESSVSNHVSLEEHYKQSLEQYVIGNLRKKHQPSNNDPLMNVLNQLPTPEDLGTISTMRRSGMTTFREITESLYSGNACKVLEIVQSSESLASTKSDTFASVTAGHNRPESRATTPSQFDNGELQMYCSKNGEALYGAHNSSFLYTEYAKKSSLYDTSITTFVLREGKTVALPEADFRDTLKKTPSSVATATTSLSVASVSLPMFIPPPPPPEPPKPELDENSDQKILVPKKVNIFGSGKRDSVIQELKMKLKQKFSSDEVEADGATLRSDGSKEISKELASLRESSSRVSSAREELALKFGLAVKNVNEQKHSSLEAPQNKKNYELLNQVVHTPPVFTGPSNVLASAATQTSSLYESSTTVYDTHESSEYCLEDCLPPPPLVGHYDVPPSRVHTQLPQRFSPDGQSVPRSWPVDARAESRFSDYASFPALLIQDPQSLDITDFQCIAANPYQYMTPLEMHHYRRMQKQEQEAALRSKVYYKDKRPRRRQQDPNLSWSDIESMIFADQQQTGLLGSGIIPSHVTRMASYKDDWIYWDQLQRMKRSGVPADRKRWEDEKTKRMLLWVHEHQSLQQDARPSWWLGKQRASLRWLVSIAYDHKPPDDIRDPFFVNDDEQENIKPSVVHALANAELYCLALAHIYADPNYSQLNHWGVIQALARKGVYVAEPSDVALTETTLMQSSPLRMSAHMAVTEAIMTLYIKEVVTGDRIANAVRRLRDVSKSSIGGQSAHDVEEALVIWINQSCSALTQMIADTKVADSRVEFPAPCELADLSDGIGLCVLIACYCPDVFNWSQIAVNEPISVADSLHNLQQVRRFCRESLPYDVCHLTLEDMLYMHGSVKQNIIAFLSDLFYLFEVRPAKSVKVPGLTVEKTHEVIRRYGKSAPASPVTYRKRSYQPVVRAIPNLRPHLGNSGAAGLRSTGGLRRQGSLQEKDKSSRLSLKEDGVQDWQLIYPDWWWSCCHENPVSKCRQCKKPTFEQAWSKTSASTVTPGMKVATQQPVARRFQESNISLDIPVKQEEQRTQNRASEPPRLHEPEPSEEFVVHKGRNIPTLNAVSRSGAQRQQQQHSFSFSAEEEKPGPQSAMAGVPSNWEAERRASGAGRRSRRNSVTEVDSHLTIENFGGSQDNLSMFARNPDKEQAVHTGRRQLESEASTPSKSVSLAYGSGTNSVASDFLDFEVKHPSQAIVRNSSRSQELDYAARSATVSRMSHRSDETDYLTPRARERRAYEEPELIDRPRRPESRGLYQSRDEYDDRSRRRDSRAYEDSDPAERPRRPESRSQYVARDDYEERPRRSESRGPSIGRYEGDRDYRDCPPPEERPRRPESRGLVPRYDEYGERPRRSESRGPYSRNDDERDYLESEERTRRGMSSYQRDDDYEERPRRPESRDAYVSKLENIRDRRGYDEPQGKQQPIVIFADSNNMGENPVEAVAKLGKSTNFAELSKLRENFGGSGLSIVYMHSDSDSGQKSDKQSMGEKERPKSLFVASERFADEDASPAQAELLSIRLKMEQKRRLIEAEKRKAEVMASKQRQSVGKAAFLQAVSKGKASGRSSPDSGGGESLAELEYRSNYTVEGSTRLRSMEEMTEDSDQRWVNESIRSRSALQTPTCPGDFNEQFYLHQQSQRRTWGQPQPIPVAYEYQLMEPQQIGYAQPPPTRRAQWGQPQPVHPMVMQPHFYPQQQPTFATQNTYDMPQQNGFPLYQQQRQPVNAPFRLHDDNSGRSQSGMSGFRENNNSLSHDASHSAFTLPRQMDDSPNRFQPIRDGRRSEERESPVLLRSRHTSSQEQKRDRPTSATSQGSGGHASALHTQLPVPSVDDMEPQSISFIEIASTDDVDSELPQRIQRLNLSSGSRTYRIPDVGKSPPRPSLSRSFFKSQQSGQKEQSPRQSPERELEDDLAKEIKTAKLKEDADPDLGFVITFDDSPKPRRPKPQLGARKNSATTKSSTPDSLPSPATPKVELTTPKRQSFSSLNRLKSEPHERSPSPIGSPRLNSEVQQIMERIQPQISYPRNDESRLSDQSALGFVIENSEESTDGNVLDEMEKRKEMLLIKSMKRKQEVEEAKMKKEMEAQIKKEQEAAKEEEKARKREEEKTRRAAIFEQYKLKKAIEEAEKEGRPPPNMPEPVHARPSVKVRPKGLGTPTKPRPKTIHVDSTEELGSRSRPGSTSHLTESRSAVKRSDGNRGSNSSLSGSSSARRGSNSSLHADSLPRDTGRRIEAHSGRKQANHLEVAVPSPPAPSKAKRSLSRGGSLKEKSSKGLQKSSGGDKSVPPGSRQNSSGIPSRRFGSLMNLSGASNNNENDYDNHTVSRTPKRAPSPGMGNTMRRGLQSPSGPGSLPHGLVKQRSNLIVDDNASDAGSTASTEYIGPRLYKQPAAKSNRSIILNAVEYCVFPGVVNRQSKQQVLEEIARSEAKHFLVLFRDAGSQFRALYEYFPDTEEVYKIWGNGPKQVTANMFEKFFKYNSGGKCFSVVHTRNLTVTIDAFTIQSSLWSGKKTPLPNRKDMTLVI